MLYTPQEAQLAKIAKQNGYDQKRFEAEILPKFKAGEIDAEGNLQEKPKKPASMKDIITSYNPIETLKKNVKQVGEFVQGGLTGAIRGAGDVAKYGSYLASAPLAPVDYITNKLTGGQVQPLGQQLRDLGRGVSGQAENIASGVEKGTQKMAGLNPESKTSKVAGFVGESLSTAPVGEGVLKLASPVLKGAGKALYKTAFKPTVEEAGKTLGALAKGSKLPQTVGDTALKYGVSGGQTGVGVKGLKKAGEIFTKTIEPAFTQAEKQGVKFNYSTLIKTAKDKILNSGVYSQAQKKEILSHIDDLAKGLKGTTGLKNLDLEKQAIVGRIPKKLIGAIKVPKELNAAQNALSDVFRDTVHDTLSKKFGIKSAELYKDYANLRQLEKMGIKGLTSSLVPEGGSFTGISTLYNTVATPVKTIGGKVLYKLGEGIEFTGPKGIKTLGQFLKKAGYGITGTGITKLGNYVSNTLND